MAGKADFTESEWETLQKGVTGAGMLVASSDRGFFDTFKEAGALTKHLAGRAAEDNGQASSTARSPRRAAPASGSRRPQKVEAETLEALRSTVALLASKAPDELDAYREFVLGVARSVSRPPAAVTTSESEAIATIAAALGPGLAGSPHHRRVTLSGSSAPSASVAPARPADAAGTRRRDGSARGGRRSSETGRASLRRRRPSRSRSGSAARRRAPQRGRRVAAGCGPV